MFQMMDCQDCFAKPCYQILVLCASALYLFRLFKSARMKPAASAVLHVGCNKICSWYGWMLAFGQLMFCFHLVEFYTLFSAK